MTCWKSLFLCCLRIANVQYKCTHVRRTCVTTQWVVGENPRRADFYFFLLPSSLVNGAMLFLCCLRIANVQCKCTRVRRTCVTTKWVVGENPRRADFYFFLLPRSLVNGAMLFLCCLRIANVQCKCTRVRRTCVTTKWVVGENPRRADFYFFLLPSSLVNGAMLFLCCLRIANVQYKCTHLRRTCVTNQWVVGENPRRADFYFFLLPSSPGNGAMLFLCGLRIANVQYKCTHVRRTCDTTQWVVGENPRRADFYFFLLPSSLVNGAMLFLCCLRIANVQYKCTHVRRTCVSTQWVVGENPRRAYFYFFLLPSSLVNGAMLFLCCLRNANVQYKCTHVRLTCVTTQWVVGENPRRADFYFFLLPSSLVNGAMLFLCCLRIANVQYKCTHVRRTCVTTQWVVGENPRRADFYFFLLPSSLVNGAMLFLCCLRIANVQYKCTHVRRTCVTTQWVVGENPRRADFYFFLLPSSLVNGAMLFLCCLRIANVQVQAHTLPMLGLVSRPSGWSEKIRVARIFIFSFCQAPWSMGQCCFCVVCALPMYNTSAHTYVGCRRKSASRGAMVNGAMLFLCCLRIANVQYKCTHVRRTCVTTQWVVGENPRRADFYFFLLPSSLVYGAMLFLCCLRIAKYNTIAHTYVGLVSRPSGWSEKIRVADFYFFLLPSSLVNGAMLFLCCLRIANVQYKCTHVRRTCVTTQWVVGENPRRADFFCLLPSSLVNGAMLLPIYNTSAHTT